MTESLQARLERLEMLHSEHDYTIQALDETVARQQREINRLNLELDRFRQQLQSLSADSGDTAAAAHEKPPHY